MDNFPFVITEIDEEQQQIYKDNFTGDVGDYVFAGPKKYFLYGSYKKLGPIFYNYPVRSDDVWFFGYPRSGTTLMQEMIWLICNDLNYEKASQTIVDLRFHYFERGSINRHKSSYDKNMEINNKENIAEESDIPNWKLLLEQKERRFIKAHLPISLFNPDVLTKGCKVVYIVRNPKDVLVSNFYFSKSMKFSGFKGNLEEFLNVFKQNYYRWCPYLDYIKEGWDNRNNPNFLFLYYEEIVGDMKKGIKKVANFFEKELSDQQLHELENYLKIENFRKNNSVNKKHLREAGRMEDKDNAFIRRGKINGWKDYFTDKMNDEFDEWFEKNTKGYDFTFAK